MVWYTIETVRSHPNVIPMAIWLRWYQLDHHYFTSTNHGHGISFTTHNCFSRLIPAENIVIISIFHKKAIKYLRFEDTLRNGSWLCSFLERASVNKDPMSARQSSWVTGKCNSGQLSGWAPMQGGSEATDVGAVIVFHIKIIYYHNYRLRKL